MFSSKFLGPLGPLTVWHDDTCPDFDDEETRWQLMHHAWYPTPAFLITPENLQTGDSGTDEFYVIRPFFGGDLTYGRPHKISYETGLVWSAIRFFLESPRYFLKWTIMLSNLPTRDGTTDELSIHLGSSLNLSA